MDEQLREPSASAAATTRRFPTIDALRGLALLGMLIVHFHDYAQDRGPAAAQIARGVEIFAVDKFYPLFACLFGVSFAIQFERWGGRPDFLRIYTRRLRNQRTRRASCVSVRPAK